MRCKLLLPILAAFGISLSACGGPAASDAAEVRATPVRVAAVGTADFAGEIQTVGLIESEREFTLAFKTPGVLRELPVQEGDKVTKGQLLAALDPRDVDAALRQAEAANGKAQRDLARARELNAKGFVSDAVLKDLAAQAASTRQALDAARANLSYATLVAPQDGVILKRFVEANAVVAAGAPILALADKSGAFVLVAGLPGRDVVRAAAGSSAEITLDAYPGRSFTSQVSEIGADADPRTGMFRVKLRLTGDAPVLRSGLVGTARIAPADSGISRLAVPLAAILEAFGDSAIVFVVDPATSRAVKTRVRVGLIRAGKVEVTSGLNGGENVVVDGAGYLNDGATVSIVTADAR